MKYLGTFTALEDLRSGTIAERIVRTKEATDKRVEVVYQGVLQSLLPGTHDSIVGILDFMMKDEDKYRITDYKLARHADEERHREIRPPVGTSPGSPNSSGQAPLGEEALRIP